LHKQKAYFVFYFNYANNSPINKKEKENREKEKQGTWLDVWF